MFAELCSSQAEPVLLRGDLHHGNWEDAIAFAALLEDA